MESTNQSNLPSSQHRLVSYYVSVDASTLTQMNLNTLAQRCAQESQHFYNGQPSDPSFAYELFRRALVEQDQLAWHHIYAQFFTLVESWVKRSSAFAQSGESIEFFINGTFIRFWQAITPERFATFTTLPALLNYLQQCAKCVVIDNARKEQRMNILTESAVSPHLLPQIVFEEEVLDRVSRIGFWDRIDALLHTEAEQVVIFMSYVQNLKPSAIQAQRPDLFTDVSEVYVTKRNVLERLSHNKEVQDMFENCNQ